MNEAHSHFTIAATALAIIFVPLFFRLVTWTVHGGKDGASTVRTPAE